jgi:beta-lactamase regulating signal transducer with metallopeptidase domain
MTSTWLLGGVSIGAFLAWATALLLAGLILSVLLRKRPSRAHCALLLSMLMCLALLPLGLAVQRAGLGLLRPVAAETMMASTAAPLQAPTPAAGPEAEPAPVERESTATAVSSPKPAASTAAKPRPKMPSAPVGVVLAVFWISLSALAVVRFVVSLVGGARLLRNARPCHDAGLQEAIDAAIAALGIRFSPAVYVSSAVRSPVIWCWRLHPALLVPASFVDHVGGEHWRGVLCHELAHVKRRDHWAALLSELLLCVFPWHPLVWASKRRLAHLSELACDDWAVACGQNGPRYAESLVDLAPQRRPILAPSAATSRNGLKRRIQRILAGHPGNPRTGLAWASGLVALFCVLGALAALTQSCGPEPEPEPEEQTAYYYYGATAEKQNEEEAESSDEAVDEETEEGKEEVEEEKEKRRLEDSIRWFGENLRGEPLTAPPGRSGPHVGRPPEPYAHYALQLLQKLPPDIALRELRANWDLIAEDETKKRLTRGLFMWRDRSGEPSVFRAYPALLDMLHLCVTDSNQEVRFHAHRYLNAVAFRNLGGDPEAYQVWYEQNRDKPIDEVLVDSSADFVDRLRAADAFGREELMQILTDAASDDIPLLRDVPGLSRQLIDSGLLDVYADMIRQEDLPEHLLRQIFGSLHVIPPIDDFIERVVYPTYRDETAERLPKGLAYELLLSLDPWHARLLMEDLTEMLANPPEEWSGGRIVDFAQGLAGLGDYRAVPQLIAAMQRDPDNEHDTAKGLGEALFHLAQVPFDPSHDAAWWRQWWEKNRQRFDPEIAAADIPEPDSK